MPPTSSEIKEIYDSEMFSNVAGQIYSHLMAKNIQEQEDGKDLVFAKEAMNTAFNAAYVYTINFDGLKRNHMLTRMRSVEDKQ